MRRARCNLSYVGRLQGRKYLSFASVKGTSKLRYVLLILWCSIKIFQEFESWLMHYNHLKSLVSCHIIMFTSYYNNPAILPEAKDNNMNFYVTVQLLFIVFCSLFLLKIFHSDRFYFTLIFTLFSFRFSIFYVSRFLF